MVIRIHLSFVFCLLAAVSSSWYSAAHEIPDFPDGITGFPHPPGDAKAEDTDPTNEAEVRDLAAHWYWHLNGAVGSRGAQDLLEFRLLFQADKRTWVFDKMRLNLLDVYFDILVDAKSYDMEGRSVLGYKDANEKEIIFGQEGLFNALILPPQGMSLADLASCITYNPTPNESSPRYMCAYPFQSIFYMVAGLDLEPGDLPSPIKSAWTEYIEGWITAQEVLKNNDKETLKEFVDATAAIYASLLESQGGNFTSILKLQVDHKVMPWRAQNVYLFVMTDEGNVLFNALDRSFEGASLNVTDKAGNNIWELIMETLTEGRGEGFFEYYWDNPDDHTDDVRGPEGLPIPGKSPGNSFKIGYVKAVDASSLGLGRLIIGSGIYPEEEEGGCSISRPGTVPGSGLLSLFLIVSVLVTAVSWKNRSEGRQGVAGKGDKTSVLPDLKRKGATKAKTFPFVFLFFFALMAVSGSEYAEAHEIEGFPVLPGFEHPQGDAKAEDVDPTNEAEVRGLAAHWLRHVTTAFASRTVDYAGFRKSLRNDKGTWSSNSMHMIISTNPFLSLGKMYVLENSKSPDLNGRNLTNLMDARGTVIAPKLQTAYNQRPINRRVEFLSLATQPQRYNELLEFLADCVDYYVNPDDAEPRWVCFYPLVDLFILVGLDPVIEDLPEIERSFYTDFLEKRITAVDVAEKNDKKTLKEFVDTVASLYVLAMESEPGKFSPLLRLQSSTISRELWKSGNVYLFAMSEEGEVIYNALDRSLEGGSLLNVTDKAGNNIWELIMETLKEGGGEGFFEYYWDNPDDHTDDVRGPEGLPIPGKSPGNSFKIGYVKAINAEIGVFPKWIIGSGIYPEEEEGGCSISRSGTVPGSGLLNLFLIVSVLVVKMVSWKNHPDSGRTKRLD